MEPVTKTPDKDTLLKDTLEQIEVGRKIFENLVEYPLPRKTHVKDFIFYFVSNGDDYGKSARKFFKKYYPYHDDNNGKTVGSLEELITILSQKTSDDDLIREIVIVAHGNNEQLLLPIMQSAETDYETRFVSAGTLTGLQREFFDNKFTEFRKTRQIVVKRLSEQSWITIRACSFGNSKSGIYCLYAFFGGRANLFAPSKYQFFADVRLSDNDSSSRNADNTKSRFTSKLGVYKYLHKHGYIKNIMSNPSRTEKIVNYFLDPPKFHTPFVLASNFEEPAQYEALKKELDRVNSNITNVLIPSRLREQGFELSQKAKIQQNWIIRDTIVLNGKTYSIKYYFTEEKSPFTDETTIYVYPHLIIDTTKSKLPIQLFLDGAEHDELKGRRRLSDYDYGIDDDSKKRFDEKLSQLDNSEVELVFSDLMIWESDPIITLSGQEKIEKVPDDENRWILKSKNENASSIVGTFVRRGYFSRSGKYQERLYFYKKYHSDKERNKQRFNLLARENWGEDPDTPGVELLAYLDTFSYDELSALIRYLRKPYKPFRSKYIHHAYLALKRKGIETKGDIYFSKLKDTIEFNLWANQPLGAYSEQERLIELEDSVENINYMLAESTWESVKPYSLYKRDFQDDLFDDKYPKASEKPRLAWTIPLKKDYIEVEPDDPTFDSDQLRNKKDFEKFIGTEKIIPMKIDKTTSDLSCEIFKKFLSLIKYGAGAVEPFLTVIGANAGSKDIRILWEDYLKVVEDAEPTMFDYFDTSIGKTEVFFVVVEFIEKFELLEAIEKLTFALGALAAIGSSVIMIIEFCEAIHELQEEAKRKGQVLGMWEGAELIEKEIERSVAAWQLEKLPEFNFEDDAPNYREALTNFMLNVFGKGVSLPVLDYLEGQKEYWEEGYADGIKMASSTAKKTLQESNEIIYENFQKIGLDTCMVNSLFADEFKLAKKNKVKAALLLNVSKLIKNRAFNVYHPKTFVEILIEEAKEKANNASG